MSLLRIIKNPRSYWSAAKLIAAGWYFDNVMKTFKAGDCVFEIPNSLTNRTGRGYFALNLYEYAERKLISKYIEGHERVLELGACIGVVSCLTNRKLADPKKHVVIEANPSLITFLTRNRELNSSQFTIIEGALSINQTEIFHFGASMVSGSLLEGVSEKKQASTVQGRSFLQIEREASFEFNTLIMDIEGGEVEIFDKQPTILEKLNLVILENHPHIVGLKAILRYESLLRQNGFELLETIDTTSVWKRKVCKNGAENIIPTS